MSRDRDAWMRAVGVALKWVPTYLLAVGGFVLMPEGPWYAEYGSALLLILAALYLKAWETDLKREWERE